MNYEYVGICYPPGSTGTYLEYIGNVFLIPTIPYHDPFTPNGSSHNRIKSPKSVFRSGHFYLSPLTFPQHQFEFLNHPYKMVWMKVDKKDFDKFNLVRKYKITSITGKFGKRNEKAEISDPAQLNKFIKDQNWKHYNIHEELRWLKDKSPFVFNWGALFSQDTFFAELEKLCDFCNIEFEPSDRLISIHSKFLDMHGYVLG